MGTRAPSACLDENRGFSLITSGDHDYPGSYTELCQQIAHFLAGFNMRLRMLCLPRYLLTHVVPRHEPTYKSVFKLTVIIECDKEDWILCKHLQCPRIYRRIREDQ
jgi:hypothetical protein